MFISQILLQVILPVILLIVLGIVYHRVFQFDLKTFSKLILYFYLPALAFVKVYEAKATAGLLLQVIGFLCLNGIAMASLGWLVSRLGKHNRKLAASFSNSVVLSNQGNVGIPVNDLAFQHNPLAMSVQLIAVLFEMLLAFTYGLVNASSADIGLKKTVGTLLKLPIFYMLVLGMLCNLFEVKIPDFLWIPLQTVSNGMLAIALVSIGAQVANIKLQHNTAAVVTSCVIRLMASPVIALLLIVVLQIEGIAAQALWIASAMPSSRNSAALALEYNNEPEFAAQTVLISTLVSSVTLTGVIYLANLLFKTA